jgi:hypothetical protein
MPLRVRRTPTAKSMTAAMAGRPAPDFSAPEGSAHPAIQPFTADKRAVRRWLVSAALIGVAVAVPLGVVLSRFKRAQLTTSPAAVIATERPAIASVPILPSSASVPISPQPATPAVAREEPPTTVAQASATATTPPPSIAPARTATALVGSTPRKAPAGMVSGGLPSSGLGSSAANGKPAAPSSPKASSSAGAASAVVERKPPKLIF